MTDLSEDLPIEIMVKIFQSLSHRDLGMAALVCRRWREMVETPALWSSFPLVVNSKNPSVIREILSCTRLQPVRKLIVKTRVLVYEIGFMSFMDLPELRELEILNNNMTSIEPGLIASAVKLLEKLNLRNTYLTTQQTEAILSSVCEEGSKLISLDFSNNCLTSVKPAFITRALTKLKTFHVRHTMLTAQQIETILTGVSEGTNMANLDLSDNDLTSVDPGLMARAVTRLKTLNVRGTYLAPRVIEDILATVAEGSSLAHLDLSGNKMTSIDAGLLGKAVTCLGTLDVRFTYLTHQQIEAINRIEVAAKCKIYL